MSVKIYTRLSNKALEECRNQCIADPVFALLTETQQNEFIADAVDQYNKLSIELGLGEYEYDTISDADILLQPTKSTVANLYLAYLKIKFGEYDGEDIVINDVDATKTLLSLDEGNITVDDTDANFVVYTLPITGATLNKTYQIIPPYPQYVDVEVSGNNVIVTARKNHVAFDIKIEKDKEV